MLERLLVPALIASLAVPLPVAAQQDRIILVVEGGNDAINNIKQRTARETIVQVQDENHRPIAGAAVAFLLPDSGPGGVFPNGAKSASVVTGSDGRAVMPRLTPNNSAGQFQIRVNASYRGQQASTTINQQNVAAAAAAKHGWFSGKVIAIVAGVAAAGAAAGAVAATRGGGSTPSATISPGTASIGAPH